MAGEGRADARLLGLLRALFALAALLAAGLALGGLLLWREYGRLRDAAAAGGASARALAGDVAHRQQAAARELATAARDATRQIAAFERRAEELRERRGGPISSANRAIEISQLMADEMLLQLKLMTTLASVLEKGSRPLEEERALLRPAERDGPPAEGGRQGRTPPAR